MTNKNVDILSVTVYNIDVSVQGITDIDLPFLTEYRLYLELSVILKEEYQSSRTILPRNWFPKGRKCNIRLFSIPINILNFAMKNQMLKKLCKKRDIKFYIKNGDYFILKSRNKRKLTALADELRNYFVLTNMDLYEDLEIERSIVDDISDAE